MRRDGMNNLPKSPGKFHSFDKQLPLDYRASYQSAPAGRTAAIALPVTSTRRSELRRPLKSLIRHLPQAAPPGRCTTFCNVSLKFRYVSENKCFAME